MPDFLDAAPLDPFNGKPLSIITTNDGIAVYSVGRNMTDDRGDFTTPNGKYIPSDIGFRLVDGAKRRILIIPIGHDKNTP